MAACIEDVLAQAERDEAEKLKSIAVVKELELEFDVGNLLAHDKNRVDARELRGPGPAREDFLRALARDNTQLLVNEIWKLPTERVGEAVVVRLPDPVARLPREKPAPRPRPPTKWEEFAKLKGIKKKKNRDNLVWDEVAKEWKRRFGFKRARDDTKEWLIEVPATADPNEDQFAKRNAAKKERVARNELNRLRNIARAQKVKPPAAGLPPPAGGQSSKADLVAAADVAMASTASHGRFQERLPKEKPHRNAGKKRQFEPLIGDFSGERRKQLEILKAMDGKRPRIDVTKAANKQMREDDREEAAARFKKGKRGRDGGGFKGGRGGRGGKGRGGKPGGGGGGKPGGRGRAMGGGGRGGAMHQVYRHNNDHIEVFTTVCGPQAKPV
ncbi:unnamed protein product [Merluccius merluccius]